MLLDSGGPKVCIVSPLLRAQEDMLSVIWNILPILWDFKISYIAVQIFPARIFWERGCRSVVHIKKFNGTPMVIKVAVKIVLFLFCLYGCSDHGVPQEILDYTNKRVGGKFMGLTTQGLFLTTATLFLGFFQRPNGGVSIAGLRSCVESIHTALLLVMLPLEIIVAVMYWALHLICPGSLDQEVFIRNNIQVSLFTNLCLHLFPLVALVFEVHERSVERSNLHICILILLGLFYYHLCKEIAKINKTWPYPFLNELTEGQRIAVYLGLTLVAVLLYELVVRIKSTRSVKNEKKNK